MAARNALSPRRHLPRARLHAVLPLAVENGGLVLPELVLWALNLQEGDLLTVESLERGATLEIYRFRSYSAELESMLDLLGDPWPYVEPELRRPLAAVGPKGTLLLPEDTAVLAEPEGGALPYLRAEWGRGWLFEISLERELLGPPVLWLRKEYTLPILAGCRISLPEEVLWLLGVQGGGRLACGTSFAEADYELAAQAGDLGDRSWVDLAPDGTLALPASLCKLQSELVIPPKEARLTVHLSGFGITLLADPEFGDSLR